jgi:hypothetical protein
MELPTVILAQQDNQNFIAGHRALRVIQIEYTQNIIQLLKDRTGSSYWISTSSGINSYNEVNNQWTKKKNGWTLFSGRSAQSSDGKLWNTYAIYQPGFLRFCDEEGCHNLTEKERHAIPVSSNWNTPRDFINAIFPSQDIRL